MRVHSKQSFFHWIFLVAGLRFAAMVSLFGLFAHGQEPPADAAKSVSPADLTGTGRMIRIQLPITGSSDDRIKRTIDQYLEDVPPGGQRPVFVFEFWPPVGSDGIGSEFERCLSLARYLSRDRLSRVRTVAFVPKSVVGHAVLVALACEEIIVAPDAVFGEAGRGDSSISPTVRSGYAEIAENRRTVPTAVALGMLDKDLEVFQVTTQNSGVLFVLAEDLEKVKAERGARSIDTIKRAGELGKFHGDKMRSLGFASYLAGDRNELATALKIDPENLEFDPSLGGDWQAIRVEITGPVNASAVDRVLHVIQQQQESNDVNFVCLQIDSAGGSASESIRLANFLADLDRSRIRTVAYIPGEARSDAALIATGCDHVVVRPNAVIGGYGEATIPKEQGKDLKVAIREIAKRKMSSWSIPAAFVDSDCTVFRYTHAENNRTIYASEEELRERFAEAEANRWTKGDKITIDDKVLELDGKRAEEIGFARFSVENFDELMQLYQLDVMPRLIGPNWAYEFVEILASPQVASGLLFIGIFALYIEITSPGLGIGGFVATVCFLLFFWANFMNGTAELLEVILFLTGIAFVLLEIFAIPGFGVFGLGGEALILASLVLATQTFVIPTNEYQMEQLPRKVINIVGVFAGVIVCLVLLRKHLHRAPVLGRVMLLPPEGEEQDELSRRESLVHYEHLLGATGTATTRLTPAGKAIFGDELVDVISDGDLVAKDTRIRVVQVVGNRIIVEQA